MRRGDAAVAAGKPSTAKQRAILEEEYAADRRPSREAVKRIVARLEQTAQTMTYEQASLFVRSGPKTHGLERGVLCDIHIHKHTHTHTHTHTH